MMNHPRKYSVIMRQQINSPCLPDFRAFALQGKPKKSRIRVLPKSSFRSHSAGRRLEATETVAVPKRTASFRLSGSKCFLPLQDPWRVGAKRCPVPGPIEGTRICSSTLPATPRRRRHGRPTRQNIKGNCRPYRAYSATVYHP